MDERSLYNILEVISILDGVIHGSHNTTCSALRVGTKKHMKCMFNMFNTCISLLAKSITVP